MQNFISYWFIHSSDFQAVSKQTLWCEQLVPVLFQTFQARKQVLCRQRANNSFYHNLMTSGRK